MNSISLKGSKSKSNTVKSAKKILIATDSFKHSLGSELVAKAIEKGIRELDQKFETTLFPMADGGEGSFDILTRKFRAKEVYHEVLDPLLRPIMAAFGLSDDGVAIIELAKASGIQLLEKEERNPMRTSTIGTGQLIKHAIEAGAKKIYLCIGSSSTNEVGMGMAIALGYRFYDRNGGLLSNGTGEEMAQVSLIEKGNISFDDIDVEVFCDVNNTLLGENGATRVYAKQKGADDRMINDLEASVWRFSEELKDCFGKDFTKILGGGAAGGMGVAACAFLNGRIVSGARKLIEILDLESAIKISDLIITGEGKIDQQTINGKVVYEIAQLAKKHNKPVIGFCGLLEAEPTTIQKIGLNAVFSLIQDESYFEEVKDKTAELLCELSNKVIGQINLD